MSSQELKKEGNLIAAFTRGPWVARQADDGCGDIGIIADNGCVAECYHAIRAHDEKAHEECLANAHLIAAAPELYHALEKMLEMWEPICRSNGWEPGHVLEYGDALEALKKARGEA